MAAHNKPVLYLDADCEFRSRPELIGDLVRSRCDFAIYNGFADMYADRFLPVERWPGAKVPPAANRYYRFAGNIGFCAERQLFAYGLAQLYRNSLAARALLARWHWTIAAFPGCADDACLNFVFNNLTSRSWLRWLLKVRWLPQRRTSRGTRTRGGVTSILRTGVISILRRGVISILRLQ
jgi:hypothetical protein